MSAGGAFHTRSDMYGVKGIVGIHRFNICLVVVLSLSCSGVKTPLVLFWKKKITAILYIWSTAVLNLRFENKKPPKQYLRLIEGNIDWSIRWPSQSPFHPASSLIQMKPVSTTFGLYSNR